VGCRTLGGSVILALGNRNAHICLNSKPFTVRSQQ
jgi:hypothetical protein